MPWAEVYQRVQERLQRAVCSSPSCLMEPEPQWTSPCSQLWGLQPQHIHGEPCWDDPSLQGGGRRLHCALCFEVTCPAGALAILAPIRLMISGWGGRCESKTLKTLQEQDVLFRDCDWTNLEHQRLGESRTLQSVSVDSWPPPAFSLFLRRV